MNRRRLLATGLLTGAGAAWTSVSDSWSALGLREIGVTLVVTA